MMWMDPIIRATEGCQEANVPFKLMPTPKYGQAGGFVGVVKIFWMHRLCPPFNKSRIRPWLVIATHILQSVD